MAMTIKAARVNAGYTMAGAAEKLDVSLDTIRRVEHGITSPKADLLVRMLSLYGTRLEDIILPSKTI